MQIKMIKLFVAFVILFSSQGFSQAAEKSAHPLLDKYYPQQQRDTTKNIAPQINPEPVTENLPQTKPVTGIKTGSANKSMSATKLISNTKPALVATDTSVISEPVVVATDTTVVNKPVVVAAAPVPVQKKIQPKPASTPYIDTRLGSSTPAYDTWEKNNNGAGSVTTSPK
jgi:hypothetical protein